MSIFLVVFAFVMIAVITLSVFVSYLTHSSKTNSTSDVVNVDEEIIQVNVDDMKNAYDRSPGRWCDHCQMNGSHHTDKHNVYAKAMLTKK